MIVRGPVYSASKIDDAQGHETENLVPYSNVQQQSGRWAVTGKLPVT
jgi:hypothetical protein